VYGVRDNAPRHRTSTNGVGRDVANEVMVQLSATGAVCVYVHATTHVIIDVVVLLTERRIRRTFTGPADLC